MWDTRKFKLFVLTDKLDRVESLLEELLKERESFVKVKKLAKVAEMIESFIW